MVKIIHSLVEQKKEDQLSSSAHVTPKEVVASIISRSGVEIGIDYVKNVWLADPIELETTEGTVEVYEIDRPKDVNNLIILYNYLNEKYEDIDLTEADALNTYHSALVYQKLRRQFMTNSNINPKYRYYYQKFNSELYDLMENSEVFKVENARIVKLTKPVKPYKKLVDYNEYF